MDYENKVGRAILYLPMGGIFDLTKNVAPERMGKFIETVKYYIDMDFGKTDGWEMEFNSTYTKLKKIKR